MKLKISLKEMDIYKTEFLINDQIWPSLNEMKNHFINYIRKVKKDRPSIQVSKNHPIPQASRPE
jgi:hypothetical protein